MPLFYFIPQSYTGYQEYQDGFSLNELFPVNVTGIVTARDSLVVDANRAILKERITYFSDPANTDDEVRQRFFGHKKEGKYKKGDTRGWKLEVARKEIRNFDHDNKIQKISYRPFDECWIYYTPEMVDWGREKIMHHMTNNENIALNVSKQQKSSDFQHVFIHRGIAESSLVSNRTSEISYSFPLYTYTENFADKHANFNPAIYDKIKTIIPDITPKNLFDYIYAVLHSPAYRARYAEYLKSDFPRIPYPPDSGTFYALAEKGEALRALHLMESKKLEALDSTYPVSGTHMVKTPRFEKKGKEDDTGEVWINETQYFGAIPQVAWEFYIGGYQPAQKWLKDRKNRNLTLDEIQHYRKIIKALHETSHIMNEINQIPFLPVSKN